MENIKENIIDTKEKNGLNEQIVMDYLSRLENPFILLSARDISKDLHIGINQAYELLKQDDFPTLVIGKKKTVTIAAYLLWKMSKKGSV
ncbi:hypothetical protein [Thomasclavelia cocleata]|jgi:hypothetical protein|uniref:hypothetical protein n=1 Tax=Thomasclavelia cocleata TaxID=69824 RepID=UPI00272E749C|nr:hypothetical protein [Thomasclavelia cocleata]